MVICSHAFLWLEVRKWLELFPLSKVGKEVILRSGASNVALDLNCVNLLCSGMKAIMIRSMCSAAGYSAAPGREPAKQLRSPLRALGLLKFGCKPVSLPLILKRCFSFCNIISKININRKYPPFDISMVEVFYTLAWYSLGNEIFWHLYMKQLYEFKSLP